MANNVVEIDDVHSNWRETGGKAETGDIDDRLDSSSAGIY